MAIQPAQPQSIGGVLDTAFQLYKASVARVWPICLLLGVGSMLPTVYMFMNGVGDADDPFAMLSLMQRPGYWLTNVASMLISLVAMGTLYLKLHSIGTESEMGLGDALQAALGRTLVLFLTMLLFIIAIVIGSVLLIVPGLILMVSLMLCFNLVMLEDKGPVDSLKGSHHLVWGNWWRTAAILTVGFIVVFVIYIAAGVVIGIAGPLIGLGSMDPLLFGMVTGLLVGVLASLIVTPFYAALALAIYWDLKLRKEGGDLAARVGELSAA